jgi:NAD(P)-dependent dehydrogenase (short-subunit alcohol dehydrogenase family)
VREGFLVSGGSGGIGGALCRALATAGYRPVVGFARSREAANKIGAETGGVALPLDLASDQSIKEAIDTLADDPIPLAGVVLAASPPPALGAFGKIEPAEVALQWRVNVEGPRQLIAGLVRRCLRPRKSGIVIAVLSKAMGDESNPAARGMGAYLISKYGLLGLMRVVASEYSWLRTGVVRPGYTETAMLAAFDPRFLDTIRAARLGGRFDQPEVVAREVLAIIAQLRAV